MIDHTYWTMVVLDHINIIKQCFEEFINPSDSVSFDVLEICNMISRAQCRNISYKQSFDAMYFIINECMIDNIIDQIDRYVHDNMNISLARIDLSCYKYKNRSILQAICNAYNQLHITHLLELSSSDTYIWLINTSLNGLTLNHVEPSMDLKIKPIDLNLNINMVYVEEFVDAICHIKSEDDCSIKENNEHVLLKCDTNEHIMACRILDELYIKHTTYDNVIVSDIYESVYTCDRLDWKIIRQWLMTYHIILLDDKDDKDEITDEYDNINIHFMHKFDFDFSRLFNFSKFVAIKSARSISKI